MARLVKHDVPRVEPAEQATPTETFGVLDRAFERMFEPWTWPTVVPFRRPMTTARHWLTEAFIPVNEFYRDGSLVVRAELPGIDPDKDVELTVHEGTLHIKATRREEESVEDAKFVRKEIFHGSFERTLVLPDGVTESDVKATYKDGILEIVVPTPQVEPAKRIQISTS
jgi:HSP20 family protein